MIRRDGFTLVEVLVVLMIITIGILPLAMVQHRSRQEVGQADRYTQAMTRAQQQLEWAKGMGFANAAPDSGVDGTLIWRTDVDEIEVGLRRVRVTVIFPQRNRPDTLSVASLISIR
jgi:prepilin-type N-terminal cleavage/methylation domain-containing protein